MTKVQGEVGEGSCEGPWDVLVLWDDVWNALRSEARERRLSWLNSTRRRGVLHGLSRACRDPVWGCVDNCCMEVAYVHDED